MVPGSCHPRRKLARVRAVRPLFVAELPPSLDQHLRLGAAAEPFAVEQFVAQLAIEALDGAVLPRTTRRDERGADRGIAQPPSPRRSNF